MNNKWRLRVVWVWWFLLVGAICGGIAPARGDLIPPPEPTQGKLLPGSQPLLVAGDGSNVWVCRSLNIDDKNWCELFVHPANRLLDGQTLWIQARDGEKNIFKGMPKAMALVAQNNGPAQDFGVNLIYDTGEIYRADLNNRRFLTQLSGPRPAAALGYGGDLYVLAVGPEKFAPNGATTAPASSAPATQDSSPANQYWNLLAFQDGRWVQHAGLGPVHDTKMTPGAALPTLGLHYGKMIACWVLDHHLVVRSIEPTKANAGWSDPQESDVPVDANVVWPVTVGPRAFVLWAGKYKEDTTEKVKLLGGALDDDGRLLTDQMLPPIPLPAVDPAKMEISAAAGVSGNSIRVVYADTQGNLETTVVSTTGLPTETPEPIKLPPDSQLPPTMYPGFIMVALVGLLALSLWQWQQKQQTPPTKYPARVAHVNVRLAAALVDLAIPVIVVISGFQFLDFQAERINRLLGLIWLQGPASIGNIIKSPELISILGLYLLHVTIGELFWGQSIGKHLCHLRVIALDGKKPTALAILVRNFIRLFEMVPGILLIYMLMNPNRQRVGDLLARTMVISEEPPREKRHNGG